MFHVLLVRTLDIVIQRFRISDITQDGIMDKFITHTLLIYLNFIVILWMAVSDITN